MSNLPNIIGSLGELVCGTELIRPVGRPGTSNFRFLFEPVLLGEKQATYDYLVHLLDQSGNRNGAFFFLQVKTTMKGPGANGHYAYAFSAVDVARAQALKTPFLVAIVDRSRNRQEKIYFMGVDAKRTRGISRIAPTYSLKMDRAKIALYDEVARLWSAQPIPALTKFI